MPVPRESVRLKIEKMAPPFLGRVYVQEHGLHVGTGHRGQEGGYEAADREYREIGRGPEHNVDHGEGPAQSRQGAEDGQPPRRPPEYGPAPLASDHRAGDHAQAEAEEDIRGRRYGQALVLVEVLVDEEEAPPGNRAGDALEKEKEVGPVPEESRVVRQLDRLGVDETRLDELARRLLARCLLGFGGEEPEEEDKKQVGGRSHDEGKPPVAARAEIAADQGPHDIADGYGDRDDPRGHGPALFVECVADDREYEGEGRSEAYARQDAEGEEYG